MLDARVRALAYLAGALAVSIAVHGYLHRRWVRDTELSIAWQRRLRVALFALAALFPAAMVTLLAMRTLPRAFQSPIMWCAFTWIGILLFVLPISFVGEAARVLPTNPSRRRAIARTVALASGVLGVAFGGVAAVIAQLPPIIRRVRIPIARLGSSMNGYKIVQLSDIHVSATIGKSLVDVLTARVNELAPDLVVVTGDLVDGSVGELGPLLASLRDLRARDGVYFVTGNHEYLSGVDEWVAFASTSLGFRVLRNEHVAIGGVDGFDLVGVEDQAGDFDLARALRGRDPTRPAILLAHRPDDVMQAVHHEIDFQISGHTHGGQIAPVGLVLERLRQPYIYGLYAIDATLLYVTSGAGFWGPPMRLATRAEIVLFELESPRVG